MTFELPSGLPIEKAGEALRAECRAIYGSDWSNDIAWRFVRIVLEASIPAMVKEVERLKQECDQQMHRALLAESHLKDSVTAGESYVAENRSLRALNAELQGALQAITDLCKTEPANPFLADNMDRIARAVLAKAQ